MTSIALNYVPYHLLSVIMFLNFAHLDLCTRFNKY